MTDRHDLEPFSEEFRKEILAAENRMTASNPNYFPVYPGGQQQFDCDCQTLAAAYLAKHGLKRLVQPLSHAERHHP